MIRILEPCFKACYSLRCWCIT